MVQQQWLESIIEEYETDKDLDQWTTIREQQYDYLKSLYSTRKFHHIKKQEVVHKLRSYLLGPVQ